MKTSPWFSKEKNEAPYTHDETVYHDNTSCSEGKNILKKHLVFGTGHRPLCKKCAQLNVAEPNGDLFDRPSLAATGN
jgi:hypothetical protein